MTDKPTAATIFGEALEIAAGEERAAYVDRACAGNAGLKREVERLVRDHFRAGEFLERPVIAVPAATIEQSLFEAPGTVIGPYKLMEQIGEGGMGLVFAAEQHEPVRRKVALKLIKPGMDTREVIARFEAERQALALMDHPNIAKVLDAGTVGVKDEGGRMKDEKDSDSSFIPRPSFSCEAGRPYFVMELVRGLPITEHCDQHQLTTRERLKLFIDVCQAVQHAHQKGIIHRDLKPTNVLVSSHDGTPVVKVIDFGVAKAIGPQLTEKTVYTAFAQMIGTPLYMSPEQAGMSSLDVDTRSDIYSLGVLLYELLTGTTPFDKERLKQVEFDEMRRIIREEEPPRPSTRLSELSRVRETHRNQSGRTKDDVGALHAPYNATSIGAQRQSDSRRLSQSLRGELDWIVMKALEKDRNRRYETANGFAMDVQRYLADEPVQACPPSAAYRLRKFVRRNKRGLFVAALVLFFLVLLGSGVGWAVRDREAREQEAAKERAVREGRLQEQVTRALTESRDWLDQERLPEAVAAVARSETLLVAGEGDQALQSEVQQARQRVDLVAELDEIRYSPMSGKEQYDESVERNRQYANLFEKLGIDLDAPNKDDVAQRIETHSLRLHLVAALDGWADMRHNIILVETHRGNDWWQRLLLIANEADGDAVRNCLRTAVINGDFQALDELAASPDVSRLPPATAAQLVRALFWTNSPERREAAVAVLKKVRTGHRDHFGLNMGLQNFLGILKRHEEALSYLRAAEALRPNSALVQWITGWRLRELGRVDEAIACFEMAVELDPNYAMPHYDLGVSFYEQKKPDQALAHCQKALELDPKWSHAYNMVGVILRSQGKLNDAVAAYRKALEFDPKSVRAHVNLGIAFAEQKKLDEAIVWHRKAVELNPNYALAHANLGSVLRDQKRLDEAIVHQRKAIELDARVAVFHLNLGNALAAQRKLDEAIDCYKKTIELDPNYALAHNSLGMVFGRQGKLDDAIACYKKALELDLNYADAHVNLGVAFGKQGKLDAAADCFRKAVELDPKLARAYYGMAKVLYDQKKRSDAITNLRKAVELDPNFTTAVQVLAWLLATCSELELRDPAEALKFAEQGLRLAPEDGDVRRTLGAARYRAGDWKGAIEALDQSQRLPRGGDAFGWYFLAMAHWQLGNEEEAHAWHAKATAWMEKHGRDDEELRRFRAETDELLKLEKNTN